MNSSLLLLLLLLLCLCLSPLAWLAWLVFWPVRIAPGARRKAPATHATRRRILAKCAQRLTGPPGPTSLIP